MIDTRKVSIPSIIEYLSLKLLILCSFGLNSAGSIKHNEITNARTYAIINNFLSSDFIKSKFLNIIKLNEISKANNNSKMNPNTHLTLFIKT